jgi:hypothetical protein
MAATEMITLGGREWMVAPLTFRQLKVVVPAFGRALTGGSEAAVDAAIDIIHAGLSAGYPSLSRDAVLDVQATVPEMTAAVRAIATIAGLVPEGEASPGSA